MNKSDLIESIAKDTGMTKADSGRALEAVLSGIMKGVKKDSVQLVGFGTFKKSKRKARTGVNPQTGAKIKIPAKVVTTFKASKSPKY